MAEKEISARLPVFCAFLRGVNVKGTTMKMAEVCSVFEKAGMMNVDSVLASGNIIFSSDKNKIVLKGILENALSVNFNYEAFLFLKNKSEIERITTKTPFNCSPKFHIYSFIGVKEIEDILMKEFEKSKKAKGEEGAIIDNNFYWKIPKGDTLNSEFGKILGRKNLKNSFTSRNINTFNKILKKM